MTTINRNNLLFELKWILVSTKIFDEFTLQSVLEKIEKMFQSSYFISYFKPILNHGKLVLNFEFFNIMCEVSFRRINTFISSKSIYRNLPINDIAVLNEVSLIQLQNDADEFLKFISPNCMANLFIFNSIKFVLKEIHGDAGSIQLTDSQLHTINGEK